MANEEKLSDRNLQQLASLPVLGYASGYPGKITPEAPSLGENELDTLFSGTRTIENVLSEQVWALLCGHDADPTGRHDIVIPRRSE